MELVIIVVGFLIDRLTKIWALNAFKNTQEIVLIKGFFSFMYIENKGAAWSIFLGKTVFLIIFTFIILCGIIYYLLKYRPKSKIMRTALSLIIAGAVGNLFDRVLYKHVVDFIYFHYKDVYSYPVFNFADICVVVGTVLLMICILRNDSKR